MNLFGVTFADAMAARRSTPVSESRDLRRARQMSLSGAGESLPEFHEVRALQQLLNLEAPACGYSSPIPVTGQYDALTHRQFKAYLSCLVTAGHCTQSRVERVDRNGPEAVEACLSFTEEEMEILQYAWELWQASLEQVDEAGRNGEKVILPTKKLRRGSKGGALGAMLLIGGGCAVAGTILAVDP